MAGYTKEYGDANGLSFPDVYIDLPTFKDVDNAAVAQLVDRIQVLRGQGLVSEANQLMTENADTLLKYLIDARVINTWVEHLRNTQIYAKQVQQNIYIGDKPAVVQYGDIRIGQPSV